MGLFSFLKKKQNPSVQAAAHARPADAGARPALPGNPVTRMPLDTEAERERQREIARATAAKIDAIELEMTSDIFDDEPWTLPRRAPAAVPAAAADAPVSVIPDGAAGPDTDALFGAAGMPDSVVQPSSAPAVEEAAILYANGQADAAEHSLRAILSGTRHDRLPWWMLFDLYQAGAREEAFESIAIDYASRFETSPPTYQPPFMANTAASAGTLGNAGARSGFSGVAPTASLGGRLDAGIGAQLARVLAPSSAAVVRFEFGAIASATPEGCALLLDALQTLRRAGRELVPAGAEHLAGVLRPMLAIGERGAGQAPWLLLLELLLLMNREKDFEETAMDYCVTFEVSPPSFEAPLRSAPRVGAAPLPPAAGDRFMLPGIVEGDSTALLDAIDAYAGVPDEEAAIADAADMPAPPPRPPLVLDCSRLARIDYHAAGALLARLRRHAGGGRAVELRDVNHLVAALLRLLGSGAQVRLYAHRY
ncbi:STAS domain-containing protein [Massilia forsythiae]|uniref:STAS domain-containing protein n=1 Tax=Massilia forsythiae TaxID=2728020 RepID=A0A7Z2VUN8_9BURK|nr:STAS domain-containing protein [Massilia forsythiae]QJD99790.1 STAS domain-containing protein [Massilia forsythiae]